MVLILMIALSISIHAPTRGATAKNPISLVDKYISIHAPTRGATTNAEGITTKVSKFQSTLLQEERHDTHSDI